MEDKDRTKFAEMVIALGENFSSDVSDALLELWFKRLEIYPLEDVIRGLRAVLESWEFLKLPPLAVVIRAIEGDIEEAARVEARAVLEGIRRVGHYRSVVFKDPITGAAVAALGGWTQINKSVDKDETWFIKDFIAAYGDVKRLGLARRDRFPGLLEQKGGYDNAPALIGGPGPPEILEISERTRGRIPGKVKKLIKNIGG